MSVLYDSDQEKEGGGAFLWFLWYKGWVNRLVYLHGNQGRLELLHQRTVGVDVIHVQVFDGGRGSIPDVGVDAGGVGRLGVGDERPARGLVHKPAVVHGAGRLQGLLELVSGLAVKPILHLHHEHLDGALQYAHEYRRILLVLGHLQVGVGRGALGRERNLVHVAGGVQVHLADVRHFQDLGHVGQGRRLVGKHEQGHVLGERNVLLVHGARVVAHHPVERGRHVHAGLQTGHELHAEHLGVVAVSPLGKVDEARVVGMTVLLVELGDRLNAVHLADLKFLLKLASNLLK